MPLNTLPALPLPDLPISVTPTGAVDETPFGDGYEVISQSGPNAIKLMVRLKWSTINADEFAIVKNFFDAHYPASPFYYTAPGTVQKPYKVTEYSYEEAEYVGYYNLRVTLQEYHGV